MKITPGPKICQFANSGEIRDVANDTGIYTTKLLVHLIQGRRGCRTSGSYEGTKAIEKDCDTSVFIMDRIYKPRTRGTQNVEIRRGGGFGDENLYR